MLCRVFYKADGTVAIMHPAPNARQGGESDEDFLDRVCVKAAVKVGLDALTFNDIDTVDLPDRADREKWRGSKAQGLFVDPSVVTQAERRKAVEDALDAELAKPQPNAVTAIRLKRQLDKKDY